MTGEKALLRDYAEETMSGQEANLLPVDLLEFQSTGGAEEENSDVLVTAHLNWELPSGADFDAIRDHFWNHYATSEVLDYEGMLHLEWEAVFDGAMTFEEFTKSFRTVLPEPQAAAEFLKNGGIEELLANS